MSIVLAVALTTLAPASEPKLDLTGSWTMEQAYEILADGRRVTTYSEHPVGLMMVDRDGRYTIQIYRSQRPRFVSGEKGKGSPEEYREAVIGSSTHFGRVTVDAAGKRLTFAVEAASFPNWEGRAQVREFTYRDSVLTYAVPASASGNGTIAWSVWRKVK